MNTSTILEKETDVENELTLDQIVSTIINSKWNRSRPDQVPGLIIPLLFETNNLEALMKFLEGAKNRSESFESYYGYELMESMQKFLPTNE